MAVWRRDRSVRTRLANLPLEFGDGLLLRSLFLVAGMLPVAVALNKTGAAQLIAEKFVSTIGGMGHFALSACFVIVTVLLTQVINEAAAITVIDPIAIATAQKVGLEPRSAAMPAALASSMALMSPPGHAVNIMVMDAGGYTFRDYMREGIPLTIIFLIILLIILPVLMPIG